MAGGRPGAPNRLTLKLGGKEEEEAGTTIRLVAHEAGEAIAYAYGGGGGWGDPLDRDPARVLDDVLDEYVSIALSLLDRSRRRTPRPYRFVAGSRNGHAARAGS